MLLRNPSFVHVLRDQIFRGIIDLRSIALRIVNTHFFPKYCVKRELKKSELFLNFCNEHFVEGVKTFYTYLRWIPQSTLLAETLWVFKKRGGGGSHS